MATVELLYLESARDLPQWTVASETDTRVTRALVALAGFHMTITEGGPGGIDARLWRLQTVETRAIVGQVSTFPNGARWTSWVRVEVAPRLLTGDRNNLLVRSHEVALILLHDDGAGSISAGVAAAMDGQEPPTVTLDDARPDQAVGLVAGFNTTFLGGQNDVQTLTVDEVGATLGSGDQAGTATLAGRAVTSDRSGNDSIGSVDVAMLAWASTGAFAANFQVAFVCASNQQLLDGETLNCEFPGKTVAQCTVALVGFKLGWTDSYPVSDLRINTGRPAATGATVSFTASATISGSKDGSGSPPPDAMEATFAVLVTFA